MQFLLCLFLRVKGRLRTTLKGWLSPVLGQSHSNNTCGAILFHCPSNAEYFSCSASWADSRNAEISANFLFRL
jgi:hypothetical protein